MSKGARRGRRDRPEGGGTRARASTRPRGRRARVPARVQTREGVQTRDTRTRAFVVECNKPAKAAAAKCSLLLLFMVLSMSMVEKLFNYKKLWWYSVFLLSCCLVPFIVQDF